MAKFNCPSCGAEVEFKSSVSIYAVCASCGSMLVRRDKDVESIGTMAALPNEVTPLQVGTSGRYKNVTFTIIGRARIVYDAGYWNEWFIYSDDGNKGWLAEAQGNLAISFEDSAKKNEPSALTTVGTYVQINKVKYLVTDIKLAECVGSEGELPFEAKPGRRAKYWDMVNSEGGFASIEVADEQRTYIGEYVDFKDLNLSNLRELEGWKP